MSNDLDKEIVEKLPFGVVFVELATKIPFAISYLNPAAEKTFAKSSEELLGKSFLSLLLAPDGQRLVAEIVSSLKQSGEFSSQVLLQVSGGARVACILEVRPGSNDRALIMLVPTRELLHVTPQDQQVLEEVLRLSEMRYQALIENSADALALLGVDGAILYLSPAANKLLGFERDEILGRKIYDLIHEEYYEDVGKVFTEAISRPEVRLDIRARIRHKDGQWMYTEGTLTNLLHVPGVRALVNNFRDITERKKLEQQFMQAQKMESLGTLAGGIAHDFNNVLGIVVGHATLLKRACNSCAVQRRHVDNIIKAANRGASLVRQLLTFACKDLLSFEIVQVNDLVSELTKLVACTFPKTVEFVMRLEEDLPEIRADSTQIHQALLNLFVNARDAMDGVGKLTLSTRVVGASELPNNCEAVASREYILIEVNDTGSGIDPAIRSRIFEPFFTTKDLGKGSGLGLSVVFGIVENHQGFIDVESDVGRGSSFKLYLPAQQRAKKVRKKGGASSAGIPRGTEIVLIMEDEDLLRELVESVLTDFGYTVLAAPNGEVGLEIFKREQDRIDLVMVDVGMPKINGWEVLSRIREMSSSMKSLVMTGYMDPHDSDVIQRSGAGDIILKPCDVGDILRKVREVLDREETKVID